VPDLAGPAVPAGRLRDQTQPTLFVDELTLRPWQAADASAVVRAYQDPDIQRWHVRTMSEREAAEWVASWSRKWAEETGAGWAVCDDEGLLARMGLRALSLAEGVREVAYWVLPEARGRSVAASRPAGCERVAVRPRGATPDRTGALDAQHRVLPSSGQGGIRARGSQDGWHDMHLHARVQGDTTSGGSV